MRRDFACHVQLQERKSGHSLGGSDMSFRLRIWGSADPRIELSEWYPASLRKPDRHS
jgi:hypothetical protein